MGLIEILILLLLTFATGFFMEKNHYKSIKKREKESIGLPVVSFGKTWRTHGKVKEIKFVSGEVVIAGDYFKNFIASLKNIFGGRLTSMESIMDRARREAILRMKKQAKGSHIIINTKLESVMLNHVQMKNSIPKCAVIAYGTAVTFE